MIKLTRTASSVWSIDGELTFMTVSEVVDKGWEVSSTPSAVLDLSGVTRVDSAGLAMLIEWVRTAHITGGTLGFKGMPKGLTRLVNIADLNDLIAG